MTNLINQPLSNDKFTDITPLGFTKSVNLENLILTDFFQPPSLSISWHYHEKPTLLFVFGGSVEEKFKKRTFQCAASSVVVRPAEETHAHLYGSVGAKCLAIQVKSAFLKDSKQILQALDSVSYIGKSPLISAARKIQRELQIMDEASPLAIEGYFLEIIAKIIRAEKKERNSSPPQWLKNARDLANDCFKESLNLSEIAGQIGVHPAYLAEMFRKHFGLTLGEYVRDLRLEYAFREVLETRRPLAEIALEVGFYDQSHFTKRFRERFNFTPLTIRQTAKKAK